MKKIAFFLGAFLLLGIISPAVSAGSPKIEISQLKYEPYPAQPGSYLHVYFNIMNLGFEDAENLKFVLMPEYPFQLAKSENATREIGTLDAGENAVIDYKLRVALDAVEGENELKILYMKKDGEIAVQKETTINVQTLDANLAVKNFGTLKIAPGEIADLNITTKNEATSYLRYIDLKLDLTGLPFYPINNTEEKRVYQMKVDEEKTFNFRLLASPDAAAGPYKIPLNISYYDSVGEFHNKKNHITLIVSSIPRIDVSIEKSDPIVTMKAQEITLNVINKGLSKIKFLTISLKDSEGYELLSPSKVYIGDMESDDYDTVDFKIYVSRQIDKIPLRVLLNYSDTNNKEYEEESIVDLKVYSRDELKRYNIATEDYSLYIYLILAAVIAFFYWRHRKKKRK